MLVDINVESKDGEREFNFFKELYRQWASNDASLASDKSERERFRFVVLIECSSNLTHKSS